MNLDVFADCTYTNITGYTAWTAVSASDMPTGKKPLIIYFKKSTTPHDFSFVLSAKGTFYIDWGNNCGTALSSQHCGYSKIVKSTTTSERFFNHYMDSRNNLKTIKIYGPATGYNGNQPAITFSSTPAFCGDENNLVSSGNIYGVGGCLGCVFPTLSSGIRQPMFFGAFADLMSFGCYDSASGMPPSDFFDGITGEAKSKQFAYMFYNQYGGCFGRTSDSSTSGQLPKGWFSGLTGANTNAFEGMFRVYDSTILH